MSQATTDLINHIYELNDKYFFDRLDDEIQNKFGDWKLGDNWSEIDTVLYNLVVERLKPKSISIILKYCYSSKSNIALYNQFFIRARDVHGQDKISVFYQ